MRLNTVAMMTVWLWSLTNLAMSEAASRLPPPLFTTKGIAPCAVIRFLRVDVVSAHDLQVRSVQVCPRCDKADADPIHE